MCGCERKNSDIKSLLMRKILNTLAALALVVLPMAMGAAAVGADGLMVEVHNDPAHAKCDGAQSITPDQFDVLAEKVGRIREAIK